MSYFRGPGGRRRFLGELLGLPALPLKNFSDAWANEVEVAED